MGLSGPGGLFRRKNKKTYSPFYNDRLLLLGDLHCHSVYSEDGVFPVEKIVSFCRAAGLHFAAVTDHNRTDSMGELEDFPGFTLIPGMEASLNEGSGHFNVLGIRDIPLCALDAPKDEIVSYMESMRSRGARIQLNHPFAGTLGWYAGFDVPFHYVEVWNRVFSKNNQAALDWWHGRLCSGLRTVATGGTDSHTTKSERYPINGVYAHKNDPQAILQAVDRGNLFVTECSYGPWLQLRIANAITGDLAEFGQKSPLELYAERLEPGYRVRVLTNRGVVMDEAPQQDWFRHSLSPDPDAMFYRMEVWRDERTLAAFSNPIYNRIYFTP